MGQLVVLRLQEIQMNIWNSSPHLRTDCVIQSALYIHTGSMSVDSADR